MTDDDRWRARRRLLHLPIDGTVNLNNGSFAPVPIPVHERQCELRLHLARQPSDFFWRRISEPMDRARAELAEYLGAAPDELLMIQNTTFGVNIAARSLAMAGLIPDGGGVLMTDHEYGACRYAWIAASVDRADARELPDDRRFSFERATEDAPSRPSREDAARGAWAIRECRVPTAPTDPGQVVAAVEAAIRPGDRVLFFSHIPSPTGVILPAAELVAMARRRGLLTVIDGAHAPGQTPLNLRELGADIHIGNVHKWLLGPAGSAFLRVRPELRDQLRPQVVSWGWDHPLERRLEPHREPNNRSSSFWARNFEYQGSIDPTPLMVIPEVLAFRRETSEADLAARVARLRAELIDRMRRVGLEPVSIPESMRGTLTIFPIDRRFDVVAARHLLFHRFGVECPFTEVAGRRYLRVSTAWWNLPEEFDRLADAMARYPFDEVSAAHV
jgi:isopenicillin-N epimerase